MTGGSGTIRATAVTSHCSAWLAVFNVSTLASGQTANWGICIDGAMASAAINEDGSVAAVGQTRQPTR
jgi:hypothetical protein